MYVFLKVGGEAIRVITNGTCRCFAYKLYVHGLTFVVAFLWPLLSPTVLHTITQLLHTTNRGHTNLFEVNTSSARAVMYNDMSVLEQHHCATTFRILTDQEGRCDILKNLAPEMRKECREIIISAILHTDMAKHFELTAKVRCVCVSPSSPPRSSSFLP